MNHITLATEGRERLFPEDADLLEATRAVARIGGRAQLLFGIVDDHVHSVVDGDETVARYVAASLSRVLARLPGGRPLAPARIRPVNGRPHLEWLVPYVVTQVSKHGLDAHPAAWPGSCCLDLIGARRLGGFDPSRLEAALPRYPLAEAVMRSVGLDFPLELPDADGLRELGASHLWRAAGAAIGVQEPVRNLPVEVAARGVYAVLTQEAGIVDREAREAAGLSRSTWYRMLKGPADAALLGIVRRQIGLQQALPKVFLPPRQAFRDMARPRSESQKWA